MAWHRRLHRYITMHLNKAEENVMKRPALHCLVLTSMILLIAGCPKVDLHIYQPQVNLWHQGPYIYSGTQTVFPETLASFHRVQITSYDPNHQDVSGRL